MVVMSISRSPGRRPLVDGDLDHGGGASGDVALMLMAKRRDLEASRSARERKLAPMRTRRPPEPRRSSASFSRCPPSGPDHGRCVGHCRSVSFSPSAGSSSRIFSTALLMFLSRLSGFCAGVDFLDPDAPPDQGLCRRRGHVDDQGPDQDFVDSACWWWSCRHRSASRNHHTRRSRWCSRSALLFLSTDTW